MTDHENFKLKREIVQLRKVGEQQKLDIKQKDYRIVELEEEADHLRSEQQTLNNEIRLLQVRLEEAGRLIQNDDPYLKEKLERDLHDAKQYYENEKRNNEELKTTLELRDANLNHLRMQLQEVALKYKDETILKDEFHYRDEVQDNREKMKLLVEKTNQMSQLIERLMAENRVLRKMQGVPDDYQFELFGLDEINQEGQLQVEKYRAQVRALEEEVEELEEERARLRRIIRGQMAGGDLQMDEDNEGTRKALRKENQELKDKIKQYEEDISHYKQQIIEGGGGGGKIGPEMMQQMLQQQGEFKTQIMEMIKQGQGGIQNLGQTQNNQSIIQQKQQINTTGLQQLSIPPTPIPGAFGNYNDIKEGYSQRFNSKMPVDMSAAYGDSGLDQMQLKYELATLQLQNIETLRLLQEKEKEYKDLANEITQIKEDMKGKCLLVQDELFVSFVKSKEQFKIKYGELEQKYKTQQDVVAEAKIKMIQYQDFLAEIQKGDPNSLQYKFADITKKTAILDVNLIKLSRKYETLLEEFNQMKTSYLICDSRHMAREKELLEKIYAQIAWKKTAEENMKLMLTQLKESVSAELYHDIRQKQEYTQDKLANLSLKEGEYLKRIAILESAEREVYEKGERIRALEEEFIEVQLEEEVIKKRLETLDPYFAKYQQVYAHMVEFIKLKGVSPMEMFKLFDENGDGKISRNEFSQAIKNMGIPIMNDEMEVVYMFVDLDGTGQIEYHEFLRRLKRSGVNVRKAEDELLYSLYRAIKEAGMDLPSAFSAFDPDGDNIISKKDMREVLDEMGIKYDNKAIEHIFKMADTSGDNQISYEEFYVLFDDIVKQELMSQGKEIKIQMDWKLQIMIKLDQAVKDQRLTLLDVFKMIDRDGDQVVSHNEFQNMFKDMDVGVSPDDIRQLFDQMDSDRNGQITYNEMLNYLREAKKEEEKYNKMKFIQERTNQLKNQQESDTALKQLNSNATQMTTEARQAMKISILEMREKNATQRATLLIGQMASSDLQIKTLNTTIMQLQNQMERSNDTFYKEREENLHLKERLRGALSKEESERISRQLDQQKLQLVDTNSALTTYRCLYDTAVMQTKTMKLTIEKIKNDHETMVTTIKELQSISDQNMTIGKLYHHLMIARWHEAQTNQKYEKILDELRKVKLQVESYDAIILEKSNEIMQQNQIFTEQMRIYETQLTELKLKILPTVTIQRVEEQAKRIKELSEMKNEAERQNRELRMKFYELQLKADYFDTYKEKLDKLERHLRIQNPDELSQQIIEISTKYSDCKIDLLRVQRDIQITKEKEEYYQRLNRQYTDTIKKLEFDLSHADLQLRKREEEWRKKFYEQRKTIFSQLGLLENDDMNNYTKKNLDTNQKMVDLIKEKTTLNNKVETIVQDEDINLLKQQILDMEAQIKRKDIEISGHIERQKIVAGGSQIFGQKQMEEYTKGILVEEAEKVSQAGQQMLRAMQEILKDKEAEIERKERQIEQIKQDSMAHKRKDVEEIQRLSDLLHKRDSQPQYQQNNNSIMFPQQQQQDPGQIVMIENYQRTLVEKDKKIKDLEISVESERKSLKKLKEDLIKVMNERDQYWADLEKEKKLNEREKYIQKIETLQKLVNEKNKELQRVKQTVIALKEELFKISEDTINKEQTFKTKESKLNTNSTELETKLTRMLTDMKNLRQELKDKQRKVEQLEEKEILHKAQVTDMEKRNQELKAIIQAGGGKLDSEEQSVSNIQSKIQQFNQITLENAQLQKELQFLKTQQGNKQLFDKEGNLNCQSGLYFKTYEELLGVVKEYLQTKPKFNIMAELRKQDKQGIRQITMAKFFEIFSMVGIKLKTRDQKLIIDAIKTQGDLADYYYKFYYPFKGWKDQILQTDLQTEQIQQKQQEQLKEPQFSLKQKK